MVLDFAKEEDKPEYSEKLVTVKETDDFTWIWLTTMNGEFLECKSYRKIGYKKDNHDQDLIDSIKDEDIKTGKGRIDWR